MKNRNPLVVVLLSLVTLGIYDLYWLVKTKTELNAKTSQHVPTIWLLFAPALILIVGYALVIAGSTHASTYASGNNGLAALGIIISIIGWLSIVVTSMIWFFKFSKAVNEYTSGKMSTAVTFLVLWVIHLIGVALIQDAFNDMSSQPLAAQANPTMPNPAQPAAPVGPQPTAPASVNQDNQPTQPPQPPIPPVPPSA